MDTFEEQRDIANNRSDDWYDEPMLLDAIDLTDVAGGCLAGCANGSCSGS